MVGGVILKKWGMIWKKETGHWGGVRGQDRTEQREEKEKLLYWTLYQYLASFSSLVLGPVLDALPRIFNSLGQEVQRTSRISTHSTRFWTPRWPEGLHQGQPFSRKFPERKVSSNGPELPLRERWIRWNPHPTNPFPEIWRYWKFEYTYIHTCIC